MKKDLIQIAGIIDREEAAMLAESGADHLGFPLGLDIHQEDLSEGAAAAIIQGLPAGMRAVLITYLDHGSSIAELCQRLACTIVQVHGDIHVAELAELRDRAPGIAIIKSLVVRKPDPFDALAGQVTRLSRYVDAFITDTFDPSTGASGATGKTHDWTVSRRLVAFSAKPVILAGGLRPGNVGDAIRFVEPAGVDVHTGVEEASGRKDPGLVARFVEEARKAFASLRGRGGHTTPSP